MMNIVHLTLLGLLIFVRRETHAGGSKYKNTAGCSYKYNSLNDKSADRLKPHSTLPLPHVKIGIMHNGIAVSHVNLKLKKTVLANKNLPIWILSGLVDKNFFGDEKDGHDLNCDLEVMEQLGEFTIYQDPDTSSAAVYFHNRREFDGMIGYNYLMRKLSVDAIHPTDETFLQLDEIVIKSRPSYKGHEERVATNYEDLQVGINNQKYLKTYEGRVYDGYPEVLVIVSWELARDLKTVKKSDWYIAVVSYVLTLFNGVDMLYSKLQKTNIQINIAGIIIGDKESFSFLDECLQKSTKDGKLTKMIDALCINSNIRRYLSGRKNKIPIDSYDAAIFHTGKILIEYLSSEETCGKDDHKISRLHRFSNAVFNLYEVKKKNIEVILTAAVRNDKYFQYYPVVAHEIAHLMSVFHDEQPFFNDDGKCCGNIEKSTGSYWCDKCLSWSEISEKTFNLFFSSPNCCSFINKPRSLLPPGRHQMLTADEQCQCYGHKSAMKFRDFSQSFCYSNLQCIGVNNKFYHTVVPMDGTLQGDKNKVCWQKRSQPIKNF